MIIHVNKCLNHNHLNNLEIKIHNLYSLIKHMTLLYNSDKIIKSIDIYNRRIGRISFQDLINTIIQKPNVQRIMDNDKVKEIVELQDKYYKTGNHNFNFLGTINIHCCEETQKNYLVDGQHRFEAVNLLYREHNYKNEEIVIEIVKVNTMEELKFNYKMINKNTELPEFPEEIDKNIPETVASFFFDKYPQVWKNTKTIKKPNINKNKFQEALGYLVLKHKEILKKNITEEQLKKMIEDKNQAMSFWPLESYLKDMRKSKHIGNYKAKADEWKFYLGMYANTSNEYIYDWVNQIITEKTGTKIVKKKRQNKKKITKNLRANVWKTYMGDVSEAPCFCCRKNKIKALDGYECGHVIAESKGGETTLENLRPICHECNRNGNGGMGTQNMRDYIESKYPQHLKAFDANEKSTEKTSWFQSISFF